MTLVISIRSNNRDKEVIDEMTLFNMQIHAA